MRDTYRRQSPINSVFKILWSRFKKPNKIQRVQFYYSPSLCTLIKESLRRIRRRPELYLYRLRFYDGFIGWIILLKLLFILNTKPDIVIAKLDSKTCLLKLAND